jgi:uncharacterized Ntn-hydrolase superfamily protein
MAAKRFVSGRTPRPGVLLSTFSITARCPQSEMLGVGVSTKFLAVGALCPFARPYVGAIATQSFVNPYYGIDGLTLLAEGLSAEEALRRLLAADEGREFRQVAIVDRYGRAAAHSGQECVRWFGHHVGDGYVVAGNMLTSELVVREMARAFDASAAEELPERLLRALEAGQAAGGDRRGRQSAALYVVHTEEYGYVDLRVDEHPDPVAELRRVFTVAQEQLFQFRPLFPTRANPGATMPRKQWEEYKRQVEEMMPAVPTG